MYVWTTERRTSNGRKAASLRERALPALGEVVHDRLIEATGKRWPKSPLGAPEVGAGLEVEVTETGFPEEDTTPFDVVVGIAAEVVTACETEATSASWVALGIVDVAVLRLHVLRLIGADSTQMARIAKMNATINFWENMIGCRWLVKTVLSL